MELRLDEVTKKYGDEVALDGFSYTFEMGINGILGYMTQQISFPGEEILDYIVSSYDVGQIAKAMNSDMNLVALKVAELNSRGYQFRELEHRSDILSGRHTRQQF